MGQHNQEVAKAEDVSKLENAVTELNSVVSRLNTTLDNFMKNQHDKCERAESIIDKHEKILMGDGPSRIGLMTMIYNMSFQMKIVMGILGLVSTSTFGIVVKLLTDTLTA